MRFPRERVSIAEVRAVDTAVLDKLFEFYDFEVGEYFFIKGQPDKEWVVEEERRLEDLNVVYGGDQVVNYYDECLPLASTAAIIDMLSFYEESFELRAWGKGWLLINGEGITESSDDEDLVGFLWRALITAVTNTH